MAFNFKNLLYLFFPKKCPFCKTIINNAQTACSTCAKNLEREVSIRKLVVEETGKEVFCVSPFSYKNEIKAAICDYKFNGKLSYAELFAKEIAQEVIRHFSDIDYITEVPLHKKRQKERGFNQSTILAQKIGKIINVPYKEILIKSKNHKIQHTLSSNERAQNVKGAYSVIDDIIFKGKNILICDDIITTGNTLKECAKVLLKNGAKTVYCATIASANLEK